MNAKEELIKFLSDHKEGYGTELKITCAEIKFGHYGESKDVKAFLKVGYTEEDYEKFLNDMDFEYDSCYGAQELFGHIWLENGAWLGREEYDGSEWWIYIERPEVPKYLEG